ncbi:MAG: hypothetical protein IKO19_05350 [Candidatus Riflebacteria bacterium]|nr:hypothetical protein [Candidatus Riflebacteria bacterium]
MNKNIKYSIFCSIIILLGTSNNILATPFEDKTIEASSGVKASVLETQDISVKEEVKTNDASEKKSEESSQEVQSEEIYGVIQVGSSCLRLREYPWGPVLGTYTTNTRCKIIGEDGEFYKVDINGAIGYMHKNYVSTSKQPASEVEPDYPGNCKTGGYIPQTNYSSTNNNSNSSNSTPTYSNSSVEVKDSVLGQPCGDGTAAGAVTWAKDQMAGGNQKGINKNTGCSSQNENCWDFWCAAFVGSAWGHKVPQMVAGCAYEQYQNFKRDGMIHTDKNPPAGAIMFTAPTSGNKYGHVFLASGEYDENGEPIVITSGGNCFHGIQAMPLSKLVGGLQYLGWAMPE